MLARASPALLPSRTTLRLASTAWTTLVLPALLAIWSHFHPAIQLFHGQPLLATRTSPQTFEPMRINLSLPAALPKPNPTQLLSPDISSSVVPLLCTLFVVTVLAPIGAGLAAYKIMRTHDANPWPAPPRHPKLRRTYPGSPKFKKRRRQKQYRPPSNDPPPPPPDPPAAQADVVDPAPLPWWLTFVLIIISILTILVELGRMFYPTEFEALWDGVIGQWELAQQYRVSQWQAWEGHLSAAMAPRSTLRPPPSWGRSTLQPAKESTALPKQSTAIPKQSNRTPLVKVSPTPQPKARSPRPTSSAYSPDGFCPAPPPVKHRVAAPAPAQKPPKPLVTGLFAAAAVQEVHDTLGLVKVTPVWAQVACFVGISISVALATFALQRRSHVSPPEDKGRSTSTDSGSRLQDHVPPESEDGGGVVQGGGSVVGGAPGVVSPQGDDDGEGEVPSAPRVGGVTTTLYEETEPTLFRRSTSTDSGSWLRDHVPPASKDGGGIVKENGSVISGALGVVSPQGDDDGEVPSTPHVGGVTTTLYEETEPTLFRHSPSTPTPVPYFPKNPMSTLPIRSGLKLASPASAPLGPVRSHLKYLNISPIRWPLPPLLTEEENNNDDDHEDDGLEERVCYRSPSQKLRFHEPSATPECLPSAPSFKMPKTSTPWAKRQLSRGDDDDDDDESFYIPPSPPIPVRPVRQTAGRRKEHNSNAMASSSGLSRKEKENLKKATPIESERDPIATRSSQVAVDKEKNPIAEVNLKKRSSLRSANAYVKTSANVCSKDAFRSNILAFQGMRPEDLPRSSWGMYQPREGTQHDQPRHNFEDSDGDSMIANRSATRPVFGGGRPMSVNCDEGIDVREDEALKAKPLLERTRALVRASREIRAEAGKCVRAWAEREGVGEQQRRRSEDVSVLKDLPPPLPRPPPLPKLPSELGIRPPIVVAPRKREHRRRSHESQQ